jgi:ABC-2 type transport system permease protein
VATLVPGEWLRIYLCNPIASILTEMRHVMMDPHAAGAAEAIGGAEWLPIPLGIIAFVFALGCFVFHPRRAGRENL